MILKHACDFGDGWEHTLKIEAVLRKARHVGERGFRQRPERRRRVS
jgi:hypothetical protein